MKWWAYGDAGPSVVMLHAFPCDHTLWERQAQALARAGFHVHVPDLPGFGESELMDGDPSLAVVVDELIAETIQPTALVGLSVGGYLAMQWLRQAPEHITALALVDTKGSADTPQAQLQRERLAQRVESDPAQTARVLRAAMVPTLVSPENAQTPHVRAALDRWFDAVPARTVAWYQRAMARRPDSFEILQAFAGPALVIWGSDDLLSPEPEQQAMIDALRVSHAVEIPGSGHLCALEQPEVTSTVLVDFLRGSLLAQ